jgi:hypothetical protein
MPLFFPEIVTERALPEYAVRRPVLKVLLVASSRMYVTELVDDTPQVTLKEPLLLFPGTEMKDGGLQEGGGAF